jgi:hypothetical protein
MGEAHKFTRTHDFRYLTALLRNFFAATSNRPRSEAPKKKSKSRENEGITSPSETRRFEERVRKSLKSL